MTEATQPNGLVNRSVVHFGQRKFVVHFGQHDARHTSVPDSLSLSIVVPIADLADRDAVLTRRLDLEPFDGDRNRLCLGLGSDRAEVFGPLAGSNQRATGPLLHSGM